MDVDKNGLMSMYMTLGQMSEALESHIDDARKLNMVILGEELKLAKKDLDAAQGMLGKIVRGLL